MYFNKSLNKIMEQEIGEEEEELMDEVTKGDGHQLKSKSDT